MDLPAHPSRPAHSVPPATPDTPPAIWPDSGAAGTVAGLAQRLRRLDTSCGPARLVGVDGHAGSGKSTFADTLAGALGGAPVVHTDDLATHTEPFGWLGRFRAQVLDPLSHAHTARHDVYDWSAGRFAGTRPLPPAPVVLVEGVGVGRRALRPALACLLWMDVSATDAWRRGRRRDGPELSSFWDGWTAAEVQHFATDPSRPFADVLVSGHPQAYVLRPLSNGHPPTHHSQ